MVKNQLNINEFDFNENSIIPVNEKSDKIERELILKQLLFLRQDINEIKKYLLINSNSDRSMNSTNSSLLYHLKKTLKNTNQMVA